MNQEQYLKAMEMGFKKNLEITRAKNTDYAYGADAFANFRASEMIGLSVEEGILVRMTDKLMRVSNLIKRSPEVKDESISDTLSDLANYAMIMKVYIEHQNEAGHI